MKPFAGRSLLATGIFLASFVVRSLYAVELSPRMYTRDQPGIRMAMRYDASALGMLRGDGILFPAVIDPARTGLMARPPGYPIFLRCVYESLGRSFFTVQLIQNALDSLTPALVFLVASRLLGMPAAVVAGLLAAVSPRLAYASNLLSPDALSALPLLLASLVLLPAAAGRRLSWTSACLAGACVGASVWLRPNLVLLAPFWALGLLLLSRSRRASTGPCAALVLTAAIAVSPITARNYAIFGEFVPVSINGGITLWQGVAEAGGQRFGARTADRPVAREEARRYGRPAYAAWWAEPDGVWRDRDRYRRSLEVIRAQPLWYLQAMLGRMWKMIRYHAAEAPVLGAAGGEPVEAAEAHGDETRPEESDGPDRPSPSRAFRAAGQGIREPLIPDDRALALGEALSFLRPPLSWLQGGAKMTMLLAIAAGLGGLVRRDGRVCLFIALVPVYYLLSDSLFIYEWRVGTPMHAFLFMLAGAGWAHAAGGLVRLLRRST
jgi:hypothetical protein